MKEYIDSSINYLTRVNMIKGYLDSVTFSIEKSNQTVLYSHTSSHSISNILMKKA